MKNYLAIDAPVKHALCSQEPANEVGATFTHSHTYGVMLKL